MNDQLLERKIGRYSKIFQELDNWNEYFLFKTGIFQKDDFTFRFRNGYNITVARKMLGPFRECFFDDVYLKHLSATNFPEQPVILDIGANVGFFALYFFYRFPLATIHSFEPMPFCQGIIEKYIQQHPGLKWKLHRYGIWNTTGSLELFTDSTDNFSTISGVNFSSERQQKITVEVKALNELYEERVFDKIDLLKLDCEGAEYSILFNMPDYVLDKIERLAIETHVSTDGDKASLEQFLILKGFHLNESLDGTDYIVAYK
jgi:FkbM family methyltransferase